jgi:hypothetical protein
MRWALLHADHLSVEVSHRQAARRHYHCQDDQCAQHGKYPR